MLKPNPKYFLSAGSKFEGSGETPDFTVGDFWQWAYSDLQQNNIRGILAEFIVAKALGIPLNVRDTWDDYDLETLDGFKIEVKSGAYLQSWAQRSLSKITFTGLCGQEWNHKENCRGGNPKYRADIYIFAVQIAKSHEDFNQLDLDQWEFYVLTKEDLKELGTKSLSLSRIKDNQSPIPFKSLKEKIQKLKQEL